MALNLIKLIADTKQKEVIGYADQIIISPCYTPLYISAYGYPTVLRKLRIKTQRSSDTDVKYNIHFQHLGEEFHIDPIDSPKYKTTSVKLPGQKYNHLVSYNTSINEACDEVAIAKICYFSLSSIRYYLSKYIHDKAELSRLLSTPDNMIEEYIKNCPIIHDAIYKFLKSSSIPVLREWIPYVMEDDSFFLPINIMPLKCYYADFDNSHNVYAVIIKIHFWLLQQLISKGLSEGDIAIPGVKEKTKKLTANSLSDYLATYSQELIKSAAPKYKPLFIPQSDAYPAKLQKHFRYCAENGNLEFFTKQKDVITATSLALAKQRCALIVGECGTGKTAMSISAIYGHTNKANPTIVVLSQSHMVEKWKREILRLYPQAKAIIISSLAELINVEPEIRDKSRNYALFLIVSKDIAKHNFVKRPAVIWDARNSIFRCPHCGAPQHFNSSSYQIYQQKLLPGSKTPVRMYAIHEAIEQFRKPTTTNKICQTTTPLRSTYKGNTSVNHRKKNASCNHELWTAASRAVSSSWIHLKNFGWVHKDMLEEYANAYRDGKISHSIKAQKLNENILDVLENGFPKVMTPHRYSIAHYVRKKLKGCIDYCIVDEVHLFSNGSSAQTQAFRELTRAAKHTIALTGTLSNGYAEGLFHILMPMFRHAFQKKGYNFESAGKFCRKYGVQLIGREETTENGVKHSTMSKRLPGIAPSLFQDFLLETAVFISLADLNDALPQLTETPVPVELDPETFRLYRQTEAKLRTFLQTSHFSTRETAALAIQKLSIYADMPYMVAPIFSPSKKCLLEFPPATTNIDNYVSYKDVKCLELINQKLAEGHNNILVYINHVNKTDCVERLEDLLSRAGIPTNVMDTTVPANKREQWIAQKLEAGMRVLICNPRLLETGLDLPFTTIIVYETGHSLFTLRQATRRSYRISQPNPVEIYYLYFKDTVQELTLSLMAKKMHAAIMLESRAANDQGLASLMSGEDLLSQVVEFFTQNQQEKIGNIDFIKQA